MSQKNVHVSVAERRSTFKKLCAQPENRVCFDCPQKKPMWASSTFGVFICLDCAGGQRRLGTHLTFVRSVDMDEWTSEQLESMKLGGNKRARLYFRENGVTDLHQRQDLKYSSVTAKTYRNKLQRDVQAALAKAAGATAAQEMEKERKKSIDEDGEKGLEKLMTSFGGSSLSLSQQDVPTRATSAPELSEYTAEKIQPAPKKEETPAVEPEEEVVVVEKPKKKEQAPPKGTLSAGMLLGGGSTAKLPTANGTSGNSISGRRRKPTKTIGARKLAAGADGPIDFVEQPPAKKEDEAAFFDAKAPPSSRLAAAYEETTKPKAAPQSAPAQAAKTPSGNGRSPKQQKAAADQPPAGETAQARFSDVKGFGSDAFFGLEEDPKPPVPTAARFAGSQGIGSDAFFDEDFSNTDSFGQLKHTASGLLASTIDRFR